MAEDRFAVEAGFPVTGEIHADGDIEPSELPGGLTVSTIHTGRYDEWSRARGLRRLDHRARR